MVNEIKIFFDNSLLRIIASELIAEDKSNDFYQLHNTKEWYDIIEEIEKSGKTQELTIFDFKFEKFRNIYNKVFTPVKAAGGVVVNEMDEFLAIERFGKWDLPKGKVEKNESIKKAAVREVNEECGVVNIKIKDFINTTYHVYKINEKRMIKETFWYEMKSLKQSLTPQESEDITKAFWLQVEQIPYFMEKTYASIAYLLEQFWLNSKKE